MEHINIFNLTTKTPKNIVGNNEQLNINRIISTSKTDEKKNAELLLEIRKKKRERILEIYIYEYKRCLEQIKKLNKNEVEDMIFEIPKINIDFMEYKSDDCLKYISDKLKQSYMDTYILNSTMIFITWKYIELNYYNSESKKRPE